MADEYIVIRGLSERENGRWYNVSFMARQRAYNLIGEARRGSTRTSPPANYVPGAGVTLEATGVLEFGQHGGVAEVYRPVNK